MAPIMTNSHCQPHPQDGRLRQLQKYGSGQEPGTEEERAFLPLLHQHTLTHHYEGGEGPSVPLMLFSSGCSNDEEGGRKLSKRQ